MNRSSHMSEYSNLGVYTRGENEFSFNFNTSLSASKKAAFVNNVVGVVISDNYYDFLTDIIFDYEIIDKFTDVDLFEIKQSDNQIDAIEKLLNETNIVKIVKENAEPGLIDALYESIAKCIEYKTGIHRNVISESLSNLINTIDKKIYGIDTNDMIEMAQMLINIQDGLGADKILETYANSDMYKNNQKQHVNKAKKRSAKKENLNIVDGSSTESQSPVES